MDEMVTIPRKEFEALKRSSLMLQRLEGAGVDNWEGYSEAFSDEDDE